MKMFLKTESVWLINKVIFAMVKKIDPNNNLVYIKVVHTAIWIFFNVVFFYLAYAVIMNKIGFLVWHGIG